MEFARSPFIEYYTVSSMRLSYAQIAVYNISRHLLNIILTSTCTPT
jgi:hypothetical protein